MFNLVEYLSAKPFPIPAGVGTVVKGVSDEDRSDDDIKYCARCDQYKTVEEFNVTKCKKRTKFCTECLGKFTAKRAQKRAMQ